MSTALTLLAVAAWWTVATLSLVRTWRYDFDLTLGDSIACLLFGACLGPIATLIMLAERPRRRQPRIVLRRKP